ncbi:S9 family peptidase [Ferrimonas lipolytica]|uniref:S9 family peptidase n=2 Tax=Ferrimonas lipolytica TaxID=2724191 RepID=A0A6H1UKR3_9GAMM|nr:prolyl oligopeptidase family serine peptidase [Ferrimonas lipolytica]QIZ78913.1 S9 family peptidase [Ferrimonas lipolytica]
MKIGLLAVAITLCGCVNTQQPIANNGQPNTSALPPALTAPPLPAKPLTLEQIMAEPDWIARSPERYYWAPDSQAVLYQRKQHGSILRDRYVHRLDAINPQQLPLSQWGSVAQPGKSHQGATAWLYQGNLFFQDKGEVQQLTFGNEPIDDFRWLKDGRLAYWHNQQVWLIEPNRPQPKLLAQLIFSAAPQVPQATNYLAKQQQLLSSYLAKKQHQARQQFELKQLRQQQDPAISDAQFYLGETERLVELSLSPTGRYLLLALTDKDASRRAEHDIMPNYVTQSGYVDALPVRTRVAEAQIAAHRFVVLDTNTGQQQDVSYEGLSGFDEDVLISEKQQNYLAQGRTYHSEAKLRTIRLIQDWGWQQSAMVWQQDADVVAVMLEAADNKDRWIATVNLSEGTFNTEHRLHDDAWVNYTHNEFGWLGQQLYYLSEQSGYSNLYLQALGQSEHALVAGKQVVSNLTVSADQQYIYYQSNPNHPGQYEVFRVATKTGEVEQLTDLKGNLDYQLSPDEQTLLLFASSSTRPPELYTQVLGAAPQRLTNTISTEFSAYPWQAPTIVAVPSSHQQEPVYARVYLPQNYDATKQYPAVIFNHGAGYLQNAHFGWSGYFREYMFHNLLSQQGYVVMDMDYRGSKGYGRDWRTAIYRHMGHPEIDDLADGIDWMVANAAVDRARVGTYGGSYGGFMTFMALFTQPELFQAGAALRPVTDWAHYNHNYTSNILNTPIDDHIAYQRSSPIYHADGLNKPLLIMTGVLDDNVLFQDSVRLVQRLIELEKPMFETAIYPVEPHGFRQPSSWLDEYRRIFRLFEAEVK